jgi:hypothetical protein
MASSDPTKPSFPPAFWLPATAVLLAIVIAAVLALAS